MNAPTTIETDRLILRRPVFEDAADIFERYSSDPEVTRYLAWPRHRSLDDTHAFLEFSDAEWQRWPAGPYLICQGTDGSIIGSTGLGFESTDRAATGFVIAKDAWGRGYATEALRAMVQTASGVGVRTLYAMCHPDNHASRRVLEKCDFELDASLSIQEEFPNMNPGVRENVLSYVSRLEAPTTDHAGQISRSRN